MALSCLLVLWQAPFSLSLQKSPQINLAHDQIPEITHSVYRLIAFPPLGDVVTLPPNPRNGLKHRFSAKEREREKKKRGK